MESPWLRAREAASYARLSPKLLYSAVQRGELKAARVGRGRTLVFHVSWLDGYLERRAALNDPARAPLATLRTA